MKAGPRRERAARPQRGFALIAILALAALIAAFLISSGLSRSNSDVANEREQRTMNALRQAKAALIAYAASVDWRLQAPSGTAYLQPGALPCPDTNGNGTSNCSGSSASSQIGRLPWKTMGIDDLRDASGEQIWYALSHDFRKMQCTSAPGVTPAAPSGCTRINSDTRGQLTVTGTESANNVVAVLIAPGGAIKGQARPSNTPTDYLESYAPGNGINYTFTTNAIPDQTNNDRIVVITQQELMTAVEPVVAARLERDIAPLIQTYSNKWGAYPYPTPFGDPTRQQATYKGDDTSTTINQGGLLPVTTDPTYLFWVVPITVAQIPGGTGNGAPGPDNPGSCSATYFGGGGGGSISGGPHCTLTEADCSSSTASAIICEVRYFGSSGDRPAISIKATLANAGFSFPAAFTSASPSMIGDDNNPLPSDNVHTPASTNPNYTGQWSWSEPPQVPSFFLPTTTYVFSPTAAGRVSVTFTGRLQNAGSILSGGTNGRVVITIPVPAYDTITISDWNTSADTAWFIANEWFRQTYYAVSPGFLPAAGNTCAPGPCLRVKNLRPAYTPNVQNKQAVLVLAGRSFTGLPRTTDLTQYFEGANLTAANGTTPYIYENRVGVPTSINDRVVVVFPPPP